MYKSALIKRDLLIYCKELTGVLENNSKLIEQSFHCMLLGDSLHDHNLQPGDPVYLKHHLHKIPCNFTEQGHIRYCQLTSVMLNLRALTHGFMFLI